MPDPPKIKVVGGIVYCLLLERWVALCRVALRRTMGRLQLDGHLR